MFYFNLVAGWALSIGSLVAMVESKHPYLWVLLLAGMVLVVLAAEDDSAWEG